MNSINRQELKKRLIQEGYVEANGLDRTIDNLLSLDGKAAEMLVEWYKNDTRPEFEAIEGVDSTWLRDTLKMKEPAIILSYGMLLRDPKVNSAHLKDIMRHRNQFRK